MTALIHDTADLLARGTGLQLPACLLLLLLHCPQHPPTDPPAPSMPCVCATLLQIEKKPYYHVLKLAGFVGFDGDFKG